MINAGKLCHLATTFEKAGKIANIPFKVTPHILRATAVTYLKQQDFSDSGIQKVTGMPQVKWLMLMIKVAEQTMPAGK